MRIWSSALRSSCLAGALTISCVAQAQTGDVCEGFTIATPGEGRVVSYHQLGADGPGPGDLRPGLRKLVDMDGNTVGTLRWYETLIGPEGDVAAADVSVVRYYMMLPDGTLLAEHLNVSENDRTDVGLPPIVADELIILGGLGRYAGARGTIEQTVGVDGDPLKVVYNVNPIC